MPELPDIAKLRALFDAHVLDRTISGVHVANNRILHETNPQGLGRRLKGKCFSKSQQHGKYLLGQIGTEGWLALHFGMTGDLLFYHNEESPPKKEAIRIDFRDGGHLAIISQRLLGKLTWAESLDALRKDEQLGPDALDQDLSSDSFVEFFAERRGMLKSALMNQSIIAGIGNVYADEILFQSNLPAKANLRDMDPNRLREVYGVMRRVLRTAAKAHIENRRLPQSYLTPHRASDADCPRCGSTIQTKKVSGRTSYFCPQCQAP